MEEYILIYPAYRPELKPEAVSCRELYDRFKLLASYFAEGTAAREDNDAALFQRLLPDEPDLDIMIAMREHAFSSLSGILAAKGWRGTVVAERPEDSERGNPSRAALDYMARVMVCDWLRLRGYRYGDSDTDTLGELERDCAAEALSAVLEEPGAPKKASPRGYPPM